MRSLKRIMEDTRMSLYEAKAAQLLATIMDDIFLSAVNTPTPAFAYNDIDAEPETLADIVA